MSQLTEPIPSLSAEQARAERVTAAKARAEELRLHIEREIASMQGQHEVKRETVAMHEARLHWAISPADRLASLIVLRWIVNGKIPSGIRSRTKAIALLADLNAQDQADMHHIEGTKSQISQVSTTVQIILNPVRPVAELPLAEPSLSLPLPPEESPEHYSSG